VMRRAGRKRSLAQGLDHQRPLTRQSHHHASGSADRRLAPFSLVLQASHGSWKGRDVATKRRSCRGAGRRTDRELQFWTPRPP